jgi:hypothetical protein
MAINKTTAMENNLPEDDFKISEDKLREFLDSSQRDPDYQAMSNKNPNSSLTDKDIIELIKRVHSVMQSLKLGASAESQTERLIEILEKTVDKLTFFADAICVNKKAIAELQNNANRTNAIVYILIALVGFLMVSLLSILAGISMAAHQ